LAHTSNNGAASVSRSAGIKKLASSSEDEDCVKPLGLIVVLQLLCCGLGVRMIALSFFGVDSRAGC
jgi:hypothetical protein